jgi:anti-sigma factor RsiW
MTTEQALQLVHAYVDGELDPASTLEFEAHLAGSPALRAEHQRLAALQSSIRQRATRYAAPPRLQDRVLAALPSLPSYRSALGRARRWRRIAIGACIAAAVLLAWNVKVTFMGPDSEDVLLDDVVSAHVRSLMADHITDIASADRHTVKPWLSSRLDFSPPAFDFTENGFPLVGARLDYVGRNAVAAIVYNTGNT